MVAQSLHFQSTKTISTLDKINRTPKNIHTHLWRCNKVKRPSIDWESIRTFAAYIECGSYSGAARELGVTHATISRRIRLLETLCNGTLSIRRGDEIELTALGASIMETATEMAKNSDHLTRKLASHDDQTEGTLRIACTEAFGSIFLTPRLPLLFERWPTLSIELSTNHHPVSLAKRDADLGIRFARPEADELIARRLGSISYYLCGSENYLHTLQGNIKDAQYICYDGGVPDIPERVWRDSELRPEKIRFKSNSLIAQWNAARTGIGLALLPEYLINAELKLAVAEPILSRDAWAVFHRDLKHLRRLRLALEWIESCFTDYNKSVDFFK